MENLSKRAIAARANGAKSHGPTSESGKRRSSANSIRHGLLAKSIVLCNESDSAFQQFFDEHLDKLNPADGVEYAVVEEVVAAAWRLRRVWHIESTLFNKGILGSTEPSEAGRTTDAFGSLAGSNQLQLLDRYETRLHRLYQRSLKTLEQLQKVPKVQPHPEPDEPIVGPDEVPEPDFRNEPNSDPTEPEPTEEAPTEDEAKSTTENNEATVAEPANLPNEPKPAGHNQSPLSYEVRPGFINGLPTTR